MSRQEDRNNAVRSPQRPSHTSQQEFQLDAASIRKGITGISNQDLRVWELCTDVPALGNVWAYIILILNILLPGTGTMIASCLGDSNVNKTQLTIGIIQLLTSVYLLGWIFSIYWGWIIVKKSKGDHNEIR